MAAGRIQVAPAAPARFKPRIVNAPDSGNNRGRHSRSKMAGATAR